MKNSNKYYKLIVAIFLAGLIAVISAPQAHAAVAFRAANTGSASTATTSVLISAPAGIVQNDILIAGITYGGSGTTFTAVPSGWTVISNTTCANAQATVVNITMYYKIATATEPGSYTWTASGTVAYAGFIDAYSGGDTSSPIDLGSCLTNGTSVATTTAYDAPSITTTLANDMIITAHGQWKGTTPPSTYTPPTGMTEESDFGAAAGGRGIESADVIQNSAGATGIKSATASAASYGASAIVAIKASTNPLSVTTNAPTGVNSYSVTLSGAANPNLFSTKSHFRVYSADPSNCNSDTGGTRFPTSVSNDIGIGSTGNTQNFAYTIPASSSAFLAPNTAYWVCAFAVNVNAGTTGASSTATFSTADGPKDPCDAPTSGNLSIPANAICNFSGSFNGVDAGTGSRNTGVMTLATGVTLALTPGQKIAFGSVSLARGANLSLPRGTTLASGGVYVHDKDGDGFLDDLTQYVGSTASAATEFRRRNLINSNYNYSWKMSSGSATFDCDATNINVFQFVPGVTQVTDADQDGYKTVTAAAAICVGAPQIASGRTYWKNTSGAYTWLNSTQALGGGATDCNDATGAPCAPTPGSVVAASRTSTTVSWSATTGPTSSSYNLTCVSGGSCTNSSRGAQTSAYTDTGLTCGTSYTYSVTGTNGIGTSPSSSNFSGSTSACAPVLVTVDSTGDVGRYPSIAVGADGFDRIAYRDFTNTKLKYVRCTNADCSTKNTTTVDSTANVGTYTSIVLGSDGFARISYHDITNGSLKFAQCTNDDCSTKNITTVDAYAANNNEQTSSIAMGLDGLPRISYFNGSNLRFAQCTNAACTTKNLSSPDLTSNVGEYNSIAIGSDGFARISYRDFTLGALKFVQCTNAACSTKNVTSVDSTGTVGDYTSIAIASDGFARISYRDATNTSLKFAQCTNAACSTHTLTTVDNAASLGRQTYLRLGADDFARISYMDDTNLALKFAKCTNAACSTSSITTLTTGDVGEYNPSFVLDSSEFPRLSYYDATNLDLRHIICYTADCQ